MPKISYIAYYEIIALKITNQLAFQQSLKNIFSNNLENTEK